tara:strand:+ start:1162 stop:1956 length:795 start_codon:yes stop_codon:yes gene_type:complete
VYETASILFSSVMDPAKVLLAVLIAGAVLLWTRWVRTGRMLIAFATLAFAGIAMMPLGAWLIAPLEDRFPSPEPLPERVHGIVVLGGATSITTSASRKQPALNANAERLTTFAALARRYPDARLIYTGGFRARSKPSITEASVATALLADLGIEEERLTVDDSARNTIDNAQAAWSLAGPSANEVWLLVTSARHMPRAVGAFRGAGWQGIIPYPVDYLTAGNTKAELGFNLRTGLNRLRAAQHEWIGLIVYRVMGASTAIFPQP